MGPSPERIWELDSKVAALVGSAIRVQRKVAGYRDAESVAATPPSRTAMTTASQELGDFARGAWCRHEAPGAQLQSQDAVDGADGRGRLAAMSVAAPSVVHTAGDRTFCFHAAGGVAVASSSSIPTVEPHSGGFFRAGANETLTVTPTTRSRSHRAHETG